MKHLKQLVSTLLLAAIAPVGSAMVVEENYAQPFESSTSDITDYEGWLHITDEWQPDPDSSYKYTMSYTYKNYSGHSLTTSTGTDYNSKAFGTSASHTKTSNGETYVLQDYIVSPAVSGTVTFYANRYSTYGTANSVLEVYQCDENDEGALVVGEKLGDFTDAVNALTTSSSWATCTIDLGEEFHHLAFFMDNLYIDDFGAPKVLAAEKRTVEFSAWKFPEGYSDTVTQSADGTFTVHALVTVTNSGNVTLSPDDELCKIQICKSSDLSVVYDTLTLPSAIAPGESVDFEYVGSIALAEDATMGTNLQYRTGLCWYFPAGGVKDYGAIKWFDINPYAPVMRLKEGTSWYSSKNIIDFGIGSTVGTDDFTICNNGGSDLVITSVTCPEAYSVVLPDGVDFPLTIGTSGTQPFQIVFSSEKTGAFGGDITFNVEGNAYLVDSDNYATNIVKVNGSFVADTDYHESFELGSIPAGWYNYDGSKWKVDERPTTSDGNQKTLSNTEQMNEYVGTSIVTPKLHFNEGETINFYVAKKSDTSYDGTNLFVYYSTDRSEWTVLGRLVSSDASKEKYPDALELPTTAKKYVGYGMAMPEGDYYIRFEAGYLYVDNVFGGQLVDVDYDIAPGALTAGKATVNNETTLKTSFVNINTKSLAADSYTVTFYENGEKVAVSDATPEIANGTTAFTASYYPHNAGEVELKAVLATNNGEFSLATTPITVKVMAEVAVSDVQVGEIDNSKNTEFVPVRYYYKSSKSEFVYTADDLGLTAGTKITKVTYPYYSSSTSNYTSEFRVWLQNTEDEAVGTDFATADDTMKLVYENTALPAPTAAGSQSGSYYDGYVYNFDGSIELQLDEAFEYNGGNLRVVVESLNASSYCHVYFPVDSSKARTALYKAADSKFESASTYTTQAFPVIILSTEKTLDANTGVVKDEEGNLIEGAVVTAEHVVDDNNSIIYKATTDENGAYSFTIFRSDVEGYTLTATKAGYDDYAGTTTAGEQDKEIVMVAAAAPALPETLNIIGTFKVGDEVVAWNPSNVISMTTTKSTAGVFEAKAVEFVAAGDDADYAYFYFCENSGDTLADTGRHYGAVKQGIEVENEAVNSVVSGENAFKITPTKCNVKVDLNEGTLTVTWLADGINALSADGDNVKVDVYNLKGVRILKNVDKADAMKSLQNGIYIVGGRKVIVR
jgi:hypothetical protein